MVQVKTHLHGLFIHFHPHNEAQLSLFGREPWSSSYGRRLTFWRSWVQILVPYTGWTFFTIICCKLVLMFVWKRPKINEKETGDDPFLKTALFILYFRLFNTVDRKHTNSPTTWFELRTSCVGNDRFRYQPTEPQPLPRWNKFCSVWKIFLASRIDVRAPDDLSSQKFLEIFC